VLLLLRALRPSCLNGALGRLRLRRRRGDEEDSRRARVLESRAVQSIRAYLDAHAASFERAVRLGEKAERLEEAEIPSESARNRAERARDEVLLEIDVLRVSFVEAPGEREGTRAFDRAVELLCPAFGIAPSLGRATPVMFPQALWTQPVRP
jgi:hypothetical protein